jgi:hypothetical protein
MPSRCDAPESLGAIASTDGTRLASQAHVRSWRGGTDMDPREQDFQRAGGASEEFPQTASDDSTLEELELDDDIDVSDIDLDEMDDDDFVEEEDEEIGA